MVVNLTIFHCMYYKFGFISCMVYKCHLIALELQSRVSFAI